MLLSICFVQLPEILTIILQQLSAADNHNPGDDSATEFQKILLFNGFLCSRKFFQIYFTDMPVNKPNILTPIVEEVTRVLR